MATPSSENFHQKPQTLNQTQITKTKLAIMLNYRVIIIKGPFYLDFHEDLQEGSSVLEPPFPKIRVRAFDVGGAHGIL